MKDKFKEVSGLIYTHNYFAETIRREGKDVGLIRNPHAQNPIEDFSLGFGQEFTKVDEPNGASYRIEIKKLWE